MPHKNPEERRSYDREYYANNREHIVSQRKALAITRPHRRRKNLKNRFWYKPEDKALWKELLNKWYHFVHGGPPAYTRCKSQIESKARKDANRIKYRARPEIRTRMNVKRRAVSKEKTRNRTSRYYTDLHSRLSGLLHGRIYRLLFRAKARKSARTQQLLGCTYEFFVTYLASKFKDGMSWENQGGKIGWQIDHEIACYRFDLTKAEHQKACFHFSNLNPCWRHVNERKDSLKDKSKLTDAEVAKMLESQAFLTRILPVPLALAA